MIATMLNIDSTQESILVIIIETDNLERMKNADPITIESAQNSGMMPELKYPRNFNMLIAYETDQAGIYRVVREEGPIELLRYLERGRKWVPGVDGIGFNFTKGVQLKSQEN